MKILYCKNKEAFGYYKITAIKPDDFVFGSEEMNEDNFGILSKDMTTEQITAWENKNKYCVNATETALKNTPDEFLTPEAEAPVEMPEIIIPQPEGE